ncbi:helix-turn-helix transcriptional regulator [Larkinella insperata]|uniref:Helix-turn-helix transcriptional regulator n=1 Tax=Larkinella insperata TaxID=332158 RepID=A0ABW3Q6Q4_9BACT|nr:AraC family transcriptional regulator [Larkinella insperata]
MENWLCQQSLAEVKKPGLKLAEKQVFFQHEAIGEIAENQINAGAFMIADIDFRLTKSVQLTKTTEGEAIQMHFLLKGANTIDVKAGEKRCFFTNQHTIGYLPDSESIYNLTAAGESVSYFTVIIPKEVYFTILSQASHLHADFSRRIKHGNALYMDASNRCITPAMKGVIQDIRQCQRTGDLKKLFLEAKVLELLMLQLEQINADGVLSIALKGDDRRKIQEAREILEENYQKPPTILELARLTGLNEFKLKKGFKEQWGTTIYGYVNQLRMEQARRWLLGEDRSIGEIAHLVGYKNHAHFTAAYKRYFNSLPSELHK